MHGVDAPERPIVSWRVWILSALAGAVTVGAYLVFLPWGAHKTLGPDGYLHGPYENGQIIGLVLALLIIGVVSGWFSNWHAPWVIPPVLTLTWIVDAMTHDDGPQQGDGLWPLGALMVLGAAYAATFVVVRLGQRMHRR